MTREQLLALKRRLSPRLLALQGVSGIGVSGDRLAIYLTANDSNARRRVRRLLYAEAPEVDFTLVTSGTFQSRRTS